MKNWISKFCVNGRFMHRRSQIATLEGGKVLTESQRQTVLRISKMLESMCSEFKTYHYEIVDGLESDEDATREQEMLDQHQKKTMEFIDRLGELLARPQPGTTTPASTNMHSLDRQTAGRH